MTPLQVWTIIRWPIALVLLAAVANYAYPRFIETLPTMVEFDAGGIFAAGDEPTDPVATQPEIVPTVAATLDAPSGPVTDGESLPLTDFYVNGRAANVVSEELLLSDDAEDSITMAFSLPPGDPSCMTSMTLSLYPASVPAEGVQVSLFASSLVEATEIQQNFQVDQDLRQAPTSPPMATPLITPDSPRPLELDVLAGYQTYFSLGYPPNTPFILSMTTVTQPPVGDPLAIVSSRAENERVPVLRWTGDPACPGQ